VWAFGYNALALPLAAGALLPSMGVALTPSISGALMGMSSLAVVGNSLLLQLELHAGERREAASAKAGAGGVAGASVVGSSGQGPVAAGIGRVEGEEDGALVQAGRRLLASVVGAAVAGGRAQGGGGAGAGAVGAAG
jgi:Cu+-exporting ATPase